MAAGGCRYHLLYSKLKNVVCMKLCGIIVAGTVCHADVFALFFFVFMQNRFRSCDSVGE